MPRAQNETDLLAHMAAQFRRGKGILSGAWPKWTQAKVRGINAAVEAMNDSEKLEALGVLDIGIGDQEVFKAFEPVAAGRVPYHAVEGTPSIYTAARERMATWPGKVGLDQLSFGDLVQFEMEDDFEAAIVCALDVIYHIPTDDLYQRFLDFIFGGGTHDYVVLTHAKNMSTATGCKKPGDPGFGWFPRPFVVPPGWEVIHREDSKPGDHNTPQCLVTLQSK